MYHIHHLTHQKTCILRIEQHTIEHTINHIANSTRKNKHRTNNDPLRYFIATLQKVTYAIDK